MLIMQHHLLATTRWVQGVVSPTHASSRPRPVIMTKTFCFKTNENAWSELPLKTNYSIEDKDVVLQRAESELSAFCSTLPDDHEARKCWEAFDYLRQKHNSYSSGCVREVSAGSPAGNCQNLEDLDQMVRELESTGSVENVYHILDIMKRVEDGTSTTEAHMPQEDSQDQQLLAYALDLFEKMDSNHDGRIDAAEFEDAMKIMSSELADDLAVMLDCLDAHGFVNKDQFVDIIMAEKSRLENPNADAEFLKHLSHYHPKHSMHS